MRLAWTILAVSSVLLASFSVVESGSDRHSTVSPRPPWDDTYTCQTNVCQNGGTCVYEIVGFITLCDCPETHVGFNCEIENSCYSDPCMNGGICDIDFYTNQQYCACREGWTGERCETASTVTGCSYVSCEHGGTCYYYGGSTFCICSSRYGGYFCETQQDHPCDNPLTPCANGGSCIRDGYGQYCQCTSEWAGPNCTQPFRVAELCDDFCENGGSCYIQHNYTPACACQPGWWGEQCSEPTSYLSTTTTEAFPVAELCDDFCENGGSCYIQINYTPVCACQHGWRGEHCSEPTSYQLPSTTKASRLSLSPRNTDTPSSGLQVGAAVGLSVGIVVLLVVIFAGVCVVAMTKASKIRSVPHQQSPHDLTAAPPSVIYNPNAHGDFDGGVHTVPSAGVVLPQPTKDVYGSDRYQSNIPRRYTTGPVRQQSSGMMRNPGAGAYNYGYEHGPTKKSFINAPAGHEYAYAEPAVPSVYTNPQPVPQQNGPPQPYTEALSTAYSQGPSRAPSRVSEHTYQSIAEYAEQRSPSSKGRPTSSVK